jgi:hypothetical protein
MTGDTDPSQSDRVRGSGLTELLDGSFGVNAVTDEAGRPTVPKGPGLTELLDGSFGVNAVTGGEAERPDWGFFGAILGVGME